jgi:hypothetical protein
LSPTKTPTDKTKPKHSLHCKTKCLGSETLFSNAFLNRSK